MIKTLRNILKADKEALKVPQSVQDTIPITEIYDGGIFKNGNKYSKTYRFSDINYLVASKDDQMAMFLGYGEVLNSLEVGATTKITINNRRMHRNSFRQNLIPYKNDKLDAWHNEMVRGDSGLRSDYMGVISE